MEYIRIPSIKYLNQLIQWYDHHPVNKITSLELAANFIESKTILNEYDEKFHKGSGPNTCMFQHTYGNKMNKLCDKATTKTLCHYHRHPVFEFNSHKIKDNIKLYDNIAITPLQYGLFYENTRDLVIIKDSPDVHVCIGRFQDGKQIVSLTPHDKIYCKYYGFIY